MKKLTFILVFYYPLIVFSAENNNYLTIMPITGYERVQKLSPTVHTKDRLFYGVRILYGPPLFSLEAEYTQAKDTETFATQGLLIKEDSEQAKLGIRSSIGLTTFGSWYLRAGGTARKSVVTTVKNGVSTLAEPAIRVNPYAGTGLAFRLQSNFALTAGVTVIFSDYPKKGADEYQTSLGFSISI